MKNILKKLLPAILLGAMAMLSGCGDTVTNTTQSTFVPGTLQGKVMDATTGKPITNTVNKPTEDIQMYLVNGSQTMRPAKAIFDSNNNLAGEFAFDNIPVTRQPGTYNESGAIAGANATYKVVVVKPGYQRFEAEFSFEGDAIKSPGSQDPSLVYDGRYLKIGNIYLYPEAATAADVAITVKSPTGKLVKGATVQLQQNATANIAIAEQQTKVATQDGNFANATDTNRLFPSKGLLPSLLNGTTDETGKITFKGSSLVLGGAYTPVVLPVVDGDSQQLSLAQGYQFVVGNAASVNNAPTISQTITANYAKASNTNTGLYIASVTNNTGADSTKTGTVDSTGTLTIKFNRPVVINNASTANTITTVGTPAVVTNSVVYGYSANLASSVTANAALAYAILTDTTTAARKPVATALSADGLTLTLTPNYVTLPAATEYDLTITYSAGNVGASVQYYEPTISPKDQPELQYTLFNGATIGVTNPAGQLKMADGATTINSRASVRINGPRP